MKKKNNKKLFIIDTNVLLHDFKCIYNFEENDVIIPIVVLEELDKFKRGNDLINFHAREFTRELDKLSGDMLLTANIPLGENLGNLHIETKDFSDKVSVAFPERTPDHRILAIADYICSINKDKTVVLITKDINLRMKAKSLGIIAQDYENDKVANIDDLYKGIKTIEGIDQNLKRLLKRLIIFLVMKRGGIMYLPFGFQAKGAQIPKQRQKNIQAVPGRSEIE